MKMSIATSILFLLGTPMVCKAQPSGPPTASNWGTVSNLVVELVEGNSSHGTNDALSCSADFDWEVPATEMESWVFLVEMDPTGDETTSTLAPGESDSWACESCDEYQGPGSYTLTGRISRTRAVSYDPDDTNAWIMVDQDQITVLFVE